MKWVTETHMFQIFIPVLIIGTVLYIMHEQHKIAESSSYEKTASTYNYKAAPVKKMHEFQHTVLQVPENDKGVMLVRRGELVIQPNAPATVILFHGFKCKRSDVRPLRTFIFPEYNSFIFDFRAHGQHIHPGDCCSFGVDEVKDVKAAVDFVKNHPKLRGKPVIAYGISMGGASVIEAQTRYGNTLFDAIVIDSPFDSMENVIKRGLRHVRYVVFGCDLLKPLRCLLEKSLYSPMVDKFLKFILKMMGMDGTSVATCLKPINPLEAIKKVVVPTMIIGCSRDETVPVETFEKMYENAGSAQKELWIVDGNGHVDTFSHKPEEYIRKVRSFVERAIAPKSITEQVLDWVRDTK